MTDTAQPGWTLDCSSLNITKGTTLLGNRSIVDPVPLPASRVVSFSCDPGKFILVLDHIGASEFINVDLTGTVTDQSARTFTNDGGFSTETGTQSSTATATRTQNGGSGEGVPPNSVGNKIFVDQNRDGLQDASDTPLAGVSLTVGRTDGLAATDVNGLPIAAQTSDAQGHFLFEGLAPLPAGVFYQVMVDRNASAAALAGLEPTIAGTGNDSGANSSTWTAVSTVDTSQGNTQDLSLDFGFVTVQTPAPTTPPTTEPTTPPSTEPTAPAPPTSPTSPVIPPATPVPTSTAATTPIIVPTAPQGPAGTDVPAQDSQASAPADQLAQTGPIALRALVFIGLTALLAGLAALALLRKSRTSKKEVSQ
ncbi:SdrD B-like domain-containing protein [Pseudarthrobacter sp. J1738]|uniref:SdrD B-like domain-containing protein n=1 Tax=Pseudarthrobacter sp. J1738 TaxID=3420446 RepID=UPI003D2BF788